MDMDIWLKAVDKKVTPEEFKAFFKAKAGAGSF